MWDGKMFRIGYHKMYFKFPTDTFSNNNISKTENENEKSEKQKWVTDELKKNQLYIFSKWCKQYICEMLSL